jgi:hypothetical protein
MLDYIGCVLCKKNYCDLCLYETIAISSKEFYHNIDLIIIPFWVL